MKSTLHEASGTASSLACMTEQVSYSIVALKLHRDLRRGSPGDGASDRNHARDANLLVVFVQHDGVCAVRHLP